MPTYVPFKHPRTGEMRNVKVGWSWVLFLWSGFFGLPLFMRRLNVWGGVFLALSIGHVLVSVMQADSTGARAGIVLAQLGLQIWLGFKGNELTAKNFLEQGWEFAEPTAAATAEGRQRWGITS